MRRHSLLCFLFPLAACGGGSAVRAPSPDDAVLLRIALPAGQVSRYVTSMSTTMDVAGNPMFDSTVTMRQEMYSTRTVVEAEGDTRRLSTVIDSVRMDAPGMFGMPETFGDLMKGITMNTSMTTRGAVLSAEADSGSIAEMMQPGFGSTQDLMGGLSLDLPEEPVRAGATWTVPINKTFDVGELGAIHQNMVLTYHFDRLDVRGGARHAMLSYSGTMDQTMDTADKSVGMEMHYAGDIGGMMDLDLDGGRFAAMTMEMTLSGSVDVMGQNMKMNMSMSMEQAVLPDR
jgi:hypothetical protein